jgi:hypothetical protein
LIGDPDAFEKTPAFAPGFLFAVCCVLRATARNPQKQEFIEHNAIGNFVA